MKIIGVLVVMLTSFVVGVFFAYVFFGNGGADIVKSTTVHVAEAYTAGENAIVSTFGSLKQSLGSIGEGAQKVVDLSESKVSEGAEDPQVGPDYVNIGEFDIDNEERALVANLEKMTLGLYEHGKKVKELPILSKGRPGSPWETPSGEYEVLYKTENHFSSIGQVYMPSSVQFFGNFFIHGWPYYPDGTPVSEGYSGGCIRLSTEDAAEVFKFVDAKTPVIVYGSDTEIDSNTARGEGYYLANDTDKLYLSADSYLVADIETGEIIYEKARGQVRPIASVTKLVTSLVSLEVVNQYQNAIITTDVVKTEGFAGGLVAGEVITTGDLIYPLLLESSNDAAEALARHYGRDHFIRQMNNKARSIGLRSTIFEDPSGLSYLNVSSAEDLFILAQHIFRNKKHIFDLTLKEKQANGRHMWNNISKFLDYEGYLGGKNGYTDEAGKTVVALFDLPLAEFENRKIAIILLNTNDIKRDVDSILTHMTQNVSYAAGQPASLGIR